MRFSQDLLKAATEIEIRSRRNVTALLAGNYRSPFRGSGMQFKEFRRYEPGDDIRHMSWPVTARTGKPTVKVYEEDRELNVIVVVDVSGSSLFGSGGKSRAAVYAEILALLGLAALRCGDNVGTLFFSQQPKDYCAPQRKREPLLVTAARLLDYPMEGQTSDLASALRFLQNALKTRALVIVLSDFLLPPFDRAFNMLVRRHEAILLHCYDPTETGFPPEGIFEVCDPESGQFHLLDGNSSVTRQALAAHHRALETYLQKLGRGGRADYLGLNIREDYVQKLVHFFRYRGGAPRVRSA